MLIYFGLRNSIKKKTNGSVSCCPQWDLCFSYVCVLRCVCIRSMAACLPRHVQRQSKGFLNAPRSPQVFNICLYVCLDLCVHGACIRTGYVFVGWCMQCGGLHSLLWLYMSGIQHGWWKFLIFSLSWWNTNELVKTGSSGKQMNFSWCLKCCQIPSLKCFRGTSLW